MKHRDNIEKYNGSLKELATDIGNLKYDALANFLKLLSDKLAYDSTKDDERGRQKLAKELFDSSVNIKAAANNIDVAWDISEKYM